jgi:hypothetical protein
MARTKTSTKTATKSKTSKSTKKTTKTKTQGKGKIAATVAKRLCSLAGAQRTNDSTVMPIVNLYKTVVKSMTDDLGSLDAKNFPELKEAGVKPKDLEVLTKPDEIKKCKGVCLFATKPAFASILSACDVSVSGDAELHLAQFAVERSIIEQLKMVVYIVESIGKRKTVTGDDIDTILNPEVPKGLSFGAKKAAPAKKGTKGGKKGGKASASASTSKKGKGGKKASKSKDDSSASDSDAASSTAASTSASASGSASASPSASSSKSKSSKSKTSKSSASSEEKSKKGKGKKGKSSKASSSASASASD